MDKDKLAEALRQALEMEETGRGFYEEAAKQSGNAIVQKTFRFLADNELLHMENIRRFYRGLQEKGAFPAVDIREFGPARGEALSLFSSSIRELKEKVKRSDKDSEALKFAMDLENKGYRHYEKMLKEARDGRLVELLNFLLAEEKQHYEALSELHSYLTDSANWYMYEEGSFPQG